MFSNHIDDSGSSPEQKFAIAAGIVFSAKRLVAFEREWHSFLQREQISEIHASVCAARNPHSAFAKWDDPHVERALLRAQGIVLKYSVTAFSIGVHKQDYDEVIPDDMRAGVGKSHYVWALSSVFGLSYDWSSQRAVPMEYVLDTTSKEEKRDIQEAIDYSKKIYPGHFSGHYSFRSRKDVAGLQAADLLRMDLLSGCAPDKIRYRYDCSFGKALGSLHLREQRPVVHNSISQPRRFGNVRK